MDDWVKDIIDELLDPPGYYLAPNPLLYEIYKREHEEYASFERTLREIERLPEIKTDFGD